MQRSLHARLPIERTGVGGGSQGALSNWPREDINIESPGACTDDKEIVLIIHSCQLIPIDGQKKEAYQEQSHPAESEEVA